MGNRKFDPITAIALISQTRTLLAGLIEQAKLARTAGEIDEAEFQRIIRAGEDSDSLWADRMEEIRARHGAAGQ